MAIPKKEPVKKAVSHVAHATHATHAAPAKKAERYVEGVGRRKTSIARVRIAVGGGHFSVNGKDLKQYFSALRLNSIVTAPFTMLKLADKFDVTVHVIGGGIHAQAEAVRLGLSRALEIKDPELQKKLHGLGFLTRDPRMVERKKYGFKKARRAPQWAKR